MKNLKLKLALVATILVLAVAILVLLPSHARAQGLVEYNLLCTEDWGVPPFPETVDVGELEAAFGFSPWPDNYGVLVSCTPKFDKRTNVFNKLRICGTAYEDVNASGFLDFGDVKVGEICQTIKQY